MDRVSQLRGAAGSSQDATLDTTSPPSEAYITANESSSKYFSLSEVDSTFDISSMKDESLANATVASEETITDNEELISNLSPISKKSDILDSYKIGKQIEAANILSGGVDIFDDNENSYDGDELVIDDNVEMDDKDDKQGDEILEPVLMHEEAGIGSKDSEVVLQIDGKNVDAIDIGNRLYLYRKEGQEELAAVQIVDDEQQQTSFKFLKVRENAEGNLEVYEEFEIEVPKEVPAKQTKAMDKASPSSVPVKEIDAACNKVVDRINKSPKKEVPLTTNEEIEPEDRKEDSSDNKTDPNCNTKIRFSESRKSPVIGSFTPMTYHSTPNKEGKPLTKTMVDQQLHPSRHSDNVKKTIEVHTDNIKQKPTDTIKKDSLDNKVEDKEVTSEEKLVIAEEELKEVTDVKEAKDIDKDLKEKPFDIIDNNDKVTQDTTSTALEQNNKTISTEDASEDEALKIVELCDKEDSDKDKTPTDNVPQTNVTQENCDKKTQDEKKLITIKSNDDNESNGSLVDTCKGEVISKNIEFDEKVNKSNKQSIESDSAVISIAESSSNENLDTKTVEINLNDKDDAKIEEGILIIDEDNSEGTVLTIDDIINDTESVNKKAKTGNITQSSNQATEVKLCVSNRENPSLTVHAAVNIKDETTLTEFTSENFVGKTMNNVEKDIPILTSENIINQSDKISPQSKSVTQSTKDDVKVADSQPKTIGDKKVPQDIPLEVANVTVANQITLPPQQATSLKCVNDKIKPTVNEKKSIHSPNDTTEIPTVAKESILLKTDKYSQPQPKPNEKAENTMNILYSPVKKESRMLPLAKSEAIVSDIHKCLSKHEPKDVQDVQIDEKKEKHLVIEDFAFDKIKESKEIGVKNVLKVENYRASIKPDASKHAEPKNQNIISKQEPKDKIISKTTDPKAINNIHSAAVPFGQWTEANRQEFLNKFKSKVPVTTSSNSQLKNSNDLNRRDVLKKIDSQRQTSNALSKTQEAKSIKNESVFSCKPNKEASPEVILSSKPEVSQVTLNPVSKPTDSKVVTKTEVVVKSRSDPGNAPINITNKKEPAQRTEVTVTDLISKTVEDMMHKVAAPPRTSQDEPKNNALKETKVSPNAKYPQYDEAATLDAIEMKMNELHGIPFIERPPHELPKLAKNEVKSVAKSEKEKPSKPLEPVCSKATKIPNLLPFPNKVQQKNVKDRVTEVDSEEEIIEHQPITGDIELNKKSKTLAAVEKPPDTNKNVTETTKSEVVITEKDFDKFARRNSMTYENCLTVNFDGKEPHNVVQTVVERDPVPKTYSKNDNVRAEGKPNLAYNKQQNVYQFSQQSKIQQTHKYGSKNEDCINRNQSKLQKAYQSVLTAKRQKESPITIIEDKPVKVVFMDNLEFVPRQLNVQGKELSPVKKTIPDSEISVSTYDSVDSDTMDDIKLQDELKSKTRHQRKQVLTPVQEPELELIEPKDLGVESSPKKKRKTDDDKSDKNVKYPVRKKYFEYTVPDEKSTSVDVTQSSTKEIISRRDNMTVRNDPVSAIDSLVKAAELLETQNVDKSSSSQSDSQQSTPVKRGRGRPRKYPLPEGATDKKTPSPQKKPRLIDAKPQKRDTTTDEDDSDDEIIKENWTMGKINENIVCPICNKLFRTENVVFKHVKHCTGPSPNRSDSDKRSPRRSRQSQESESKSADSKSDDLDIDDDEPLIKRATPKKRKSNDSATKSESKEDVIVIEDTPDKDKTEKIQERKLDKSRKLKAKTQVKHNDLVCEFCGKVFRQLSYLVSHKLQHKKDDSKKLEKDKQDTNKSIFSCEVCKKQFRKLHHLVQHRIIHNPVSMPTRSQRKSSLDIAENNADKQLNTSKNSEDPSAGFRCEPCDKSFRKLHHLVEHRETHDGINKHKVTGAVQVKTDDEKLDKTLSSYQCDVCKKSFRKLHHLIEHKDLHLETSSEKSDDKSVKSISTKDIIHECPLCYMVFPNEHSLTKHTVICQRKKKQQKPAKQIEGVEIVAENNELSKTEQKLDDSLMTSVNNAVNIVQIRDDKAVDKNTLFEDPIQEGFKHKSVHIENNEVINKQENDCEEVIKDNAKIIDKVEENTKTVNISKAIEKTNLENIRKETPRQKLESKNNENKKPENTQDEIEGVGRNIDMRPTVVAQTQATKREFKDIECQKMKSSKATSDIPEKFKKINESEVIEIQDTPKKKTPLKDKVAAKRVKTVVSSTVANDKDVKPPAESSDDDEIRYMFNPNFKAENVTEEKVFMKVRAKKRSSLQIERPNSKDLMKRRTSLQHPPKIPRLKPRTETNVINEPKTPKQEPVPSTDSDDSETTKYSFPTTVVEKLKTPLDKVQKDEKIQNKLIAEKRKSLCAIAKRKSLGKAVTARHKPSPLKQVKKRTLDVEHRCDCGQLFSSAALLTRHTTLAHTPPRIRRRRSPLPEQTLPVKATSRKSNATDKPKQTASRKSSVKSDSGASNNPKSEAKSGRKSVNKDTKTPADKKTKLEDKSEAKSSVKPRRTGAHKSVPVPEKMKKLMQKNK